MISVAPSKKLRDCEACVSFGGKKCGVKSASASSRFNSDSLTRLYA